MDSDDPEQALALSYARPAGRDALHALFALDVTLGRIVRAARDPLIGEMRLTWWHGALNALDEAQPPAEPVLRALAAHVLPHGVTGARLADMIDGWEALLAEPLDGAALARHARFRGTVLFQAAATVLASREQRGIETLGRGWAYADVARNLRDGAIAALARDRAAARLPASFRHRPVGRAVRPLTALALIARMNLAGAPRAGAPRRVARLAWHRLTGR